MKKIDKIIAKITDFDQNFWLLLRKKLEANKKIDHRANK